MRSGKTHTPLCIMEGGLDEEGMEARGRDLDGAGQGIMGVCP